MNDELDRLKQALTDAPGIKASSRARKAAMDAANAAFVAEHQPNEQDNASQRQGNVDTPRLNEQDSNKAAPFTQTGWRKSMKATHIISGLTGVTVVALVVVNVLQFRSMPMDEELKQAGDSLPVKTQVGSANRSLDEAIAKAETRRRAPVLLDSTSDMDSARKGMSFYAVTESYEEQVVAPAPPIEMRVARLVRGKIAAASDSISASPSRRDQYPSIASNALLMTQAAPVSTFSIDVDTGSYSLVRSSLKLGNMPPADKVRIEELINYFPYDYALPADKQIPFRASTSVLPTPWNPNTRLLHIGIKGYESATPENRSGETVGADRPRSNLVFLLDTSGSMGQPNKLPLLIKSFKLLLSTLLPGDVVSIVTYAGSAGVVLEPTKVANRADIIAALSRLDAGGSTAGGEGIKVAYELAQKNFDAAGINRIILATDGDFNVGISDPDELKAFIARKRESGVYLSVLGFGQDYYSDVLMQALAQNGNGNAAYIDSLSEARKVLVDESSSMLFTIAKDVKIQLEFNPAVVSAYRLIGYETRQLQREDFNNDKVDAGEIGAGHSVTAIYELTLAGAEGGLIDDLRYKKPAAMKPGELQTEYGFLKLRYKLPDEAQSRLIEQPIRIEDTLNTVASASDDVRFSVAVSAFGQLLRNSKYIGDFSYDDVIQLAKTARGKDEFGYRSGFIELLRLARTANDLAE